MRHLACITCGKEKLNGAQQKQYCRSCSSSRLVHSEDTKNKISQSKKGSSAWNKGKPGNSYPHSVESRRKISIGHGGNGDLNQTYPGLSAWTTRNKNKTPFCEWCYSEDNLESHHIMPKARFPQYATDDSNCRIMCKRCHTICHKQGGF
jgi:hypothetical protein